MKITMDSGYLAYEVVGEGIPLLLIHGYPLSQKIWVPQQDGLSDCATVITLDLRGHGESYPFKGPYSMNLLAEDCKNLIDILQIKSPILIAGLSMGGYVTLALYRKFPELFKGMILISTRPGPDSPEGKANRENAIKNALEHGSDFIAEGMLPKMFSPKTLTSKPAFVANVRDIMANTSVQGIVASLQGMRDRPDSTPQLPQITCPTLIVHGIDDQIIPIKEAEQMHQQIQKSSLVKIDDAGHLLNLEQPNLVNQAIRDFITSLA